MDKGKMSCLSCTFVEDPCTEGGDSSLAQESSVTRHITKSSASQLVTDEECIAESNSINVAGQSLTQQTHTNGEPNISSVNHSLNVNPDTARDNSKICAQEPHTVSCRHQSPRLANSLTENTSLDQTSSQNPIVDESLSSLNQSHFQESNKDTDTEYSLDQSLTRELTMLRKNNRYLSDLPPADEECSARQNKTSSTANKQVLERDKTLKMMRSTSQATRCNVSSPVSSVTRISTKVTRSSSSATVDLQSLSEDESSNSSPVTMDMETLGEGRDRKPLSVPTDVQILQGWTSSRHSVTEGSRSSSPLPVNTRHSEEGSGSLSLVTMSTQTRFNGMSESSTPEIISIETPPSGRSRSSTPVLTYTTSRSPSPVCVSTQTSINRRTTSSIRMSVSTQTSRCVRSTSTLPVTIPAATQRDSSGGPCIMGALPQKFVEDKCRKVKKKRLKPVITKKRKSKTLHKTLKSSLQTRRAMKSDNPSVIPKLTIKLRTRKYTQHTLASVSGQTQPKRRSRRLKEALAPAQLNKVTKKSENQLLLCPPGQTQKTTPKDITSDDAFVGTSVTEIGEKSPMGSALSPPKNNEKTVNLSQDEKSTTLSGEADVKSRNIKGNPNLSKDLHKRRQGKETNESPDTAKVVTDITQSAGTTNSLPLEQTFPPQVQKRKCGATPTSLKKKCHGPHTVSATPVCTKKERKTNIPPANYASPETTEAFKAVEEGNLERVEDLVQLTSPTVRNIQTGCTLLHAAAANNQSHVVLFLLKLISPNVVNKDGQTPAHLAAVRGHTKVLKILLSDEEMNHDKRDICHRTYKDMLSAPLLLSVLSGSLSTMETLLKLGADPDYHAGQLVRGALSRELNVTTPRQLARMLNREYMLHWFINETTTVTQENEAAMSEPPMFINNLSATLRLRVKPSSVQATGPDVYKMNTDPRGYVCILSYCSFKDRPDLDLEGSRSDVNNLASVFGKMGYTGHAHFSLTAAQTKQVLTKVRDMEVLDHVGCAVFIISSHGIGNEKFLTNDMKRLATEWVCDLFKDSECPRLKNKPKLFIFDFCCGYYQNESPRQVSTARSTRVREPLQDMMCLYSSSGDFTSYTYTKEGTPFITALCRTLVQQAHDKELCDWYREFLKEYNKLSPTSAPQLCNFGFTKKFYFNPKC